MIGTQLVNFYRDNTPAAIQSTTNIPPKASPTVNEEAIEMGIEAQPEEEIVRSEEANNEQQNVATK